MPLFLAPLFAFTASTIGEILTTTVVATVATRVVSDLYDTVSRPEKTKEDDEG